MICEFINPKIIDPENDELIDFDEGENLSTNDTVVFSGLKCDPDEEGEFLQIINHDEDQFLLRSEASTGDFVIAGLLLIVILFLFIDLIGRRILPRFIRFWK